MGCKPVPRDESNFVAPLRERQSRWSCDFPLRALGVLGDDRHDFAAGRWNAEQRAFDCLAPLAVAVDGDLRVRPPRVAKPALAAGFRLDLDGFDVALRDRCADEERAAGE